MTGEAERLFHEIPFSWPDCCLHPYLSKARSHRTHFSDSMSYYSSDESDDGFERLNSGAVPSDIRMMDEQRADRLRSLVVDSDKREAPHDPADGKTPEVCYVLNYVTLDKRSIEVYRGDKPINIKFNGLIEDTSKVGTSKPVIEIVTKVESYGAAVRKQGQRRRYAAPPPPPPLDPYGLGYSADAGIPGSTPGAQLSFSQAQKPVITIHSPYLINALQAVVGYYPSLNLTTASVEVEWPHCVLIHHRQALEKYKTNQPPVHGEEQASITARHVDVLLEYIETTMGADLHAEEARHRSSIPKATFDLLWLLYEPGKVVYARHEGHWTPFVVSRAVLWTQTGGRKPCWNIDCWNLELAGERFVRNMHAFQVEPYSGEEAIFSLPVVPAAFFAGEAESNETPALIEAKNIRLGKMVWELAKNPVYMSYDGGLVDRQWGPRQHSARTAGYMSGRVIVDCEGFSHLSGPLWDPEVDHQPRRMAPPPTRPPPPKDRLPYFGAHCGCPACGQEENKDLSTFAHFENLKPASSRAPTNDLYYLVLTKVVPGFILGERSWGHFNVEHLNPISYDAEAFTHLVLDDEIKLTVKALIGRFANMDGQVTPWPKDFVHNKGQGRIFLLHGSPGVGKTATCESIAELAHRPLISLTSGDLNLNSGAVERNLAHFLQLGERYGAMVLLDEADVYLEARRTRDVARNGLVSIFLRALEYYRGVLFLTTNRVQTFDAAFTSRVHVSLHYRSLGDGDRERIWQHSFERLERDARGAVRVALAAREYAYDSHDVRSLAWNGREIRNALQTAVALAETAALDAGAPTVTVTEAHMRAVVKMSRGFKNFLRRRRTHDDDDGHNDAGDLLEPEYADTIYE